MSSSKHRAWSRCVEPAENAGPGEVCWIDDETGEHWLFKPCTNGCDKPAEHDSPDDLCSRCWLSWWTDGWPN